MLSLIYNFIITIILLILATTITKDRQNKERNLSVIICVSFLQLVWFHSSVDPNSVPDLPDYYDSFQMMPKYDWTQVSDVFRTNEYGYHYLNKIVSIFSQDFVFYQVIVSLIILSCYYCTFIKYSPNVMLSVCLLVLSTYSQSLFVLRQHIAVGIVLFAYWAIIERKLTAYLLLCLLAYQFHHSTLLFIPIYFLCNINNKKMYFFALVATFFVLSYLSNNLSSFVSMFDVDYDLYMMDTSVNSLTYFFISLAYIISFVIVMGKKVFDQGINKMIFTLMFISCLGTLFGSSITVMNRSLMYFQVINTIAIPIIASNIKQEFVRFLFVFAVIALNCYTHLKVIQTPSWLFMQMDYLLPISGVALIILSVIALNYFIKNTNNKKYEQGFNF